MKKFGYCGRSFGRHIEAPEGRSVDHENIQRSRLRVDTRKWMLAKMLPKRFGDRATLDAAEDSRLEIVATQARRSKSMGGERE